MCNARPKYTYYYVLYIYIYIYIYRPVTKGGSLGSDESPLKNHQSIKSKS